MVTLGIDLGTSGVKIALVGDGDRVIGHSSQPLTVSRPHTGRSEQSPEDWWTATCHGLDDDLVAAHDLAALADKTGLEPQPRSGRQEHLEALVNTYF